MRPADYLLRTILILIVVFWAAVAVELFALMLQSGGITLERLGQFGDVFGCLNALFTGLTMVFLIYTLNMQREQTSAHQNHLSQQQRDGARQAREQFVTARLNAQVASIQAASAQHDVLIASKELHADVADQFLEVLNIHAMHIEILNHEISQGFDGPWTPAVEKEALRQYMLKSIAYMLVNCDRAREKQDEKAIIGVLQIGRYRFRAAGSAFRDIYHDISAEFFKVADAIDRNRAEPQQAIEWCKGATASFEKGQTPWK